MTSGHVLLGVMQLGPDPHLSAQLKTAGYDFVFVDREHGDFDLLETIDAIASAKAAGLSVLVRIEEANEALAERIAQLKPDAVIAPQVEDAVTAASLARSLGADSRAALIVVLESRRGAEQAEAIAATSGVSTVLVGPRDLSRDLGDEENYSSSAFAEAVGMIERAALSTGKLLGTAPHGKHGPIQLLDRGHRLLIMGTDRSFRIGSLHGLLAGIRAHAASFGRVGGE